MENKQILILDHDVDIHTLLSLQLEPQGAVCYNAFKLSEAEWLSETVDIDALILTYDYYNKHQQKITHFVHKAEELHNKKVSVLVMGGFSSKAFVQDLKDSSDFQTEIQSFESFQVHEKDLEHPLQICA